MPKDPGPLFTWGLYCSLTCIDLHKTILCLCLHNSFIDFAGMVKEFDIVDENTSTQGIPYEYSSVMHPGYFAFAKRKISTIVPLKIKGHMSCNAYPTAHDLLHLKIMYCAGNTCAFTTNYTH